MNTAIVLAGGSGRRMNSDIPKQYMMLKGKPVIYYSLKAFQDNLHSNPGSGTASAVTERLSSSYYTTNGGKLR